MQHAPCETIMTVNNSLLLSTLTVSYPTTREGLLDVSGSRQHAWFRARDHARLTGVKPFWRVGDFYTVDSPGSGKRYEVRREGRPGVLDYACTCPAYLAGKVCWHRALVASLPYEVALRKRLTTGEVVD